MTMFVKSFKQRMYLWYIKNKHNQEEHIFAL